MSNRLRRTAARAAILGALTVTVWTLQGPAAPAAPHTPTYGPPLPAVVQVEEDSPLWDCATMGNRQCGPTA